MKIDMFNHILPRRFFDKMTEVNPNLADIGKRFRNIPVLVDLEARFRVMDLFDDYVQVISLPNPPEILGGEAHCAEVCSIANDCMAELVSKYPDRFPGFVAAIPMNDPEKAVLELERAISKLKASGVQLHTNVLGKPIDAPEFKPVFAMMHQYDLPIWLHPTRTADFPDYQTENKSRYEIWWTFGWPYETSAAMARLVFSFYFDEFPDLKVITHHMGGMIPYFEGRVGPGWEQLGSRTTHEDYSPILKTLKHPHTEYFKMFYADTALFGSLAGTLCGLNYFGSDNVLFASDSPFDPEKGPAYIRETIKVVDALPISEDERQKIYEGNARRLLKL
jgi:predicted TIM-barrel fold metal-dependent hydrolase